MTETEPSTPDRPEPQQWLRPSLQGMLVAVMDHRRLSRGMVIEPWTTRAIANGSVHELISVPEGTSRAVGTADDCAYLGFAEFQAGLMAVGDLVRTDTGVLGTVLGFDETHMPNHQNILISSSDRRPGVQLGLQPGQVLSFRPTGHDQS